MNRTSLILVLNRDAGSQITREQRDDAFRRTEVYKLWVLHHILKVDNETALVVLPIKDAEPNYRDTDPGPPFAQEVWDPLWLSPVLGAPEISVPGKTAAIPVQQATEC